MSQCRVIRGRMRLTHVGARQQWTGACCPLRLAAREQAALAMNRLPKEPPFTAFIGNLPYDCENSDIEMFFEKEKVRIRIGLL